MDIVYLMRIGGGRHRLRLAETCQMTIPLRFVFTHDLFSTIYKHDL